MKNKKKVKKDMIESTTIENKATEKVVPFHEMTCEQMKKQYPNSEHSDDDSCDCDDEGM